MDPKSVLENEDFTDAAHRVQAYRDERKPLQKCLDEIAEIIVFTNEAIFYWHELEDVLYDEEFLKKTSMNFFMKTSNLYLDHIVLQYTKLFDNDKSAVNFNYLLNLLQNNPSKYFEKDIVPIIKEEVKKDRIVLNKIRDNARSAQTKRDKEIAHHDKINMDKKWDEPLSIISVPEIEEDLQVLEEMIIKYWKYGGYPILPSFPAYKEKIERIFKFDFSLATLKSNLKLDSQMNNKKAKS